MEKVMTELSRRKFQTPLNKDKYMPNVRSNVNALEKHRVVTDPNMRLSWDWFFDRVFFEFITKEQGQIGKGQKP